MEVQLPHQVVNTPVDNCTWQQAVIANYGQKIIKIKYHIVTILYRGSSRFILFLWVFFYDNT